MGQSQGKCFVATLIIRLEEKLHQNIYFGKTALDSGKYVKFCLQYLGNDCKFSADDGECVMSYLSP